MPDTVPTLSGKARGGLGGQPPASSGDPKPANPKAAADVAKQKTKKYDEVLNTLNKDRKMWESTLQTANDSIKAFLADNSREDYEHFLALAEVRISVLSAVLDKNITRKDLQGRLAKLTDEEKTYLPCNIDLLVRPLDMVDKIKAILVAVSKEDLATRKEAAASDISMVTLLARGVTGSVNDLTKAKERRIKSAENEKNREKRKQEMIQGKAEKRARTKEEKAGQDKRKEGQLDPHRIDKLDTASFRAATLVRKIEDVAKLDGFLPFVFKDAAMQACLVDHLKNDKLMQAKQNFMQAYRATSAAKTTGRAQCVCSPAELQPALRSGMRQFAPWNSSAVTDSVPSGNVVSVWGCVENMNFVATEYESVGQLRLVLKGRKRTFCAPTVKILDAMKHLGLQTESQDHVFRFMRNLTAQQVKDSGLEVHLIDAMENDLSYMPSGWVMADFCMETEAVGLRVTCISAKDCVGGNVDALGKLRGNASSQRDSMTKFLEAAKKLEAASV